MIGMDSYLDAYVDRRMQHLVEEYDLSTKNDLLEFTARLESLEREVPRLKTFETEAADRLAALEARARALKGRT